MRLCDFFSSAVSGHLFCFFLSLEAVFLLVFFFFCVFCKHVSGCVFGWEEFSLPLVCFSPILLMK
jgi:hypothetical protein